MHGQRVEDHQARVHAGVEVSAVQVDRAAEQQVAAAGNEERRRQAVQIGIDGREHRVFGIGAADVFRVVRTRLGRVEMSGEPRSAYIAMESPLRAKSPMPLKTPSAAGMGNPSCLSFTATSAVRMARRTCRRSRCARLVGFEQFLVDGH